MNDTHITIVGNVVDEPRLRQTQSGVPVTSFRIGSTSRRFDRETGTWIDNERLFATVTCWRAMAQNVAMSLRKGQPVVVTGRFYSREYVKDEATRMSYELDALAIGHDLARGTSEFTKVARPYAVTSVEVDEHGIPADLTGERIDTVADALDATIDAPTLASVG